jgi:hypothetical protein
VARLSHCPPEDALFVISSAIDYRRIHSIINPRTVPGSASRGRPIGPMHYAWSAPAAAATGLFSESENANVRAVTLTGEGPKRSPEGRRYTQEKVELSHPSRRTTLAVSRCALIARLLLARQSPPGPPPANFSSWPGRHRTSRRISVSVHCASELIRLTRC